jgi:hypothetical protein
MNIKTLVFEYTLIRKGYYLLTLKEEENPNRFINHPLQFTFINNPEEHFKKMKGGFKKCNN